MVLIGLLGQKRSGKDTSADYYVLKKGFIKRAFADPLKEMIKPMFQFSHDQLYGEFKEKVDERWNVSPRQVLQFVGTDLVRKNIHNLLPEVGNNFWVKNFSLWYEKHNNKWKNVVVSDVRFQNEADKIKELGGIIIKIERPDLKSTDSHESESGIDAVEGVDFIVKNDGGLEDLYCKLDEILGNYVIEEINNSVL